MFTNFTRVHTDGQYENTMSLPPNVDRSIKHCVTYHSAQRVAESMRK